MSSSWGTSWGKAWGATWGRVPQAASTAGALLGISAELIPGTASGRGAASGVTLQRDATLTPGLASGAASTPGATLEIGATLAPGLASGAASTPGALLVAQSEILPAAATGSTSAAGAMLQAFASLIPGTARGQTSVPESPDAGWQFRGLSAPINRQKKTSRRGCASGTTLTMRPTLVPGTARGSASTPGVEFEALGGLEYWRESLLSPEERERIRREEEQINEMGQILDLFAYAAADPYITGILSSLTFKFKTTTTGVTYGKG